MPMTKRAFKKSNVSPRNPAPIRAQAEYRKLDKLLAQERKTQTKVTTAFIDKVRKGEI